MPGLYVHIPFCVRKCAYCDFYSLPGRSESIPQYVQAVLTEARKYAGHTFATLYIGGGTPSLLRAAGLGNLLDGLRQAFDLSRLEEATIEANPESVTDGFLEAAGVAGINRLSLGVQSLHDVELRRVGRAHTAQRAFKAIQNARRWGFENISTDVILGLPGQDWRSLQRTLETLAGMGIPHISVYCLAIEPQTPLATNLPADLPSDDEQADLYEQATALLQQKGFIHYEISNFARRGFECLHNLNYWRGGEYLGLGTAAASHLGGQRFKNRANLDAYLENPTAQIAEFEDLKPPAKAAEEAILRLRLLGEGLESTALRRRYGSQNVKKLIERLSKLTLEGALRRDGTIFKLKPEYSLVSNPVFAAVLEDQEKK